MKGVLDTTARNVARLRGIVSGVGWPGRSAVGEDGADAAWLVLQHACSQVKTVGTREGLSLVETCVPLLRRAVERGEAHPRHLAAVVDGFQRVVGAPPVYGVLDLDVTISDGIAVVRDTDDLEALDGRRLGIGLSPLASDVTRRTAGEGLNPGGSCHAEPWPMWPGGR